MTLSPQGIAENYGGWLSDQLRVRTVEDAIQITTPFLDRHNDFLQVYAVQDQEDGDLRLTDGGHTVRDLELSGTELNTPKRERIVETILNKVSVSLDGGVLVTHANEDSVGARLQALIQAMLSVNDMYVLAQPTVARLFTEDVRAFLHRYEVEYEENFRLSGRSGYEHAFDFFIPPSRGGPPRLVEAIDSPSKEKVDRYLWTLTDTEAFRPDPTKAYAFLNDAQTVVDASLIDALRSYAVTPTLWSARQEVLPELTQH